MVAAVSQGSADAGPNEVVIPAGAVTSVVWIDGGIYVAHAGGVRAVITRMERA